MGYLTDALDGLEGSSIDKANELLQLLATAQAEDEESAQRLAMIKMLAPTVAGFLPNDPNELDQLLLAGAVLFLRGRSDDAEQQFELVPIGETARVHVLGQGTADAEE